LNKSKPQIKVAALRAATFIWGFDLFTKWRSHFAFWYKISFVFLDIQMVIAEPLH
jgi:hypothetical protein